MFPFLQVTAASSVVEVVAALNQPQHPAAVEAAARVIRSQCEEADAPREAYTTAGAIPALLAVLPRHRQHAGVQAAACWALRFIGKDNAGKLPVCLFLCFNDK
jgi:hypothetical protein